MYWVSIMGALSFEVFKPIFFWNDKSATPQLIGSVNEIMFIKTGLWILWTVDMLFWWWESVFLYYREWGNYHHLT